MKYAGRSQSPTPCNKTYQNLTRHKQCASYQTPYNGRYIYDYFYDLRKISTANDIMLSKTKTSYTSQS